MIESISPGWSRSGALDKVSARYRALPWAVVNCVLESHESQTEMKDSRRQ